MATPRTEAEITTDNNILVVLPDSAHDDLISTFCGSVVDDLDRVHDLTGKSVYLCGDIGKAPRIEGALRQAARVSIVGSNAPGEVASVGGSGDNDRRDWPTIDRGMVPLLWHGVGVYYRRFFAADMDYFEAIQTQHTFQSLTESSKPAKAHRTGLYLTPVEQHGADTHFRLLRCSTNLAGPTENFGAVDTGIVAALNREAQYIFDDSAELNHVLAQMYPNAAATSTEKQTKATISSHADKTKDMPDNGIMAFCTFYDELDILQPIADDPFDYGYKSTSGLTRLDFRMKASITEERKGQLPERFTVTLYPNSVFFMPLSTNRLYTHAIRPSQLDASQLPTRLGYVVRCSATEALHRDGATFLKRAGGLTKLQPPTPEGIEELRKLYADENKTDAYIDYGDRFDFSMNSGDYNVPNSA